MQEAKWRTKAEFEDVFARNVERMKLVTHRIDTGVANSISLLDNSPSVRKPELLQRK